MTVAIADAVLSELAEELRAEESVISAHVLDPETRPRLAKLTVAVAPERPYLGGVIECVREGYLLHYGTPRVLAPPDPELALLAGDYLYARALETLAGAGELAAIRELADLISLSAQIHASHSEPVLASARLWLASAIAIGSGSDPGHVKAKERLRVGGDSGPLGKWALATAARLGAGDVVAEVGESVGLPSSNG
ncbi:MAG: hypothetical protein ACR2K6_00185 [Solirubrobacterales bacterium]